MAKSKHFYIRRTHRYLGIFLGIQFLFWTIGGLYFSWSNMDEVHGDLEKKPEALLTMDTALVSPTVALQRVQQQSGLDSFATVKLVRVLDSTYYLVSAVMEHSHGNEPTKQMQHDFLVNAVTGIPKGSLNEKEAVEVASRRFKGTTGIKAVKYLTSVGGHHEYRNGPFPAYAVTFDNPLATTVYVAANLGTVQKFRNSKWRTFDFLWMLHTMDYESRDDIGNWVLRIFSILGLLTVISGFMLYFISTKRFKQKKGVVRS